MNLRRIACAVMVLVAAVCLTPAAKADSISWNWSYTDGGANTGSGTFITGLLGNPYTVTGVTGIANGLVITGLSLYAGADNLLYAPPTAIPGFVDFGGISFVTLGGREFNLGGGSYGQYVLNDSLLNPLGVADVPGSSNIKLDVRQNVPEPSTLLMLGLGLVGVGLITRKKQRQAA